MSSMNLYWVETEDHAEDWFILAQDERQATVFHEDSEGYDSGDASALLVMAIPDGVEPDLLGTDEDEPEVGWPSLGLLRQCGARILRDETPRIVEIAGQRFCEGLLDHQILQLTDDAFEACGDGRLNRTDRAKD
jgi:hypothetical protein